MRPENTIPAFEYAIAHGVDVLELDMYVTKDNVVVVSHDDRWKEFAHRTVVLEDGCLVADGRNILCERLLSAHS